MDPNYNWNKCFENNQHLNLLIASWTKPCFVYRIIGITLTQKIVNVTTSIQRNVQTLPKKHLISKFELSCGCLLNFLQMGVNLLVLELIDNHRSCRDTFITREEVVSSYQIKESTKWLLKIEACTDSCSFEHLHIYFGHG